MRARPIATPVAIAIGGLVSILACSGANFGGGNGKLAGGQKGNTGEGTGGATAGTPTVPWTQVQHDCASEISRYCAGKTSQADVDSCLKTAAATKGSTFSSTCVGTLNNYNNPGIGGNGTAGGTAGSSGSSAGGVGSDGGLGNGGQVLGTDGGGSLSEKRADLILTYSAYTGGDGDPSNTATVQFSIKAATDTVFQPVNTVPLVPTGSDSTAAASMQTTRVSNACKCGQITTFQLKWSATGTKGTFAGQVDTDDKYMWLMSRVAPGQPSSDRNTHWSDDAVGNGPNGTSNVMYMGEDHPAAGGTPCSVPYFYCGTFSQQAACPNHPWDCMDDIRMRWECDQAACGASDAAGTGLDIQGSNLHQLDPTP
jgi:hypothetical protein